MSVQRYQENEALGVKDAVWRGKRNDCSRNADLALDPISDDYHPPMQDSTEHRGNYTAHRLPLRVKKDKRAYDAPTAKLEEVSMYNMQYRDTLRQIDKVKSCKPEYSSLRSDDPLSTNTTHHDDYDRKKIDKVQSYRPKYVAPSGRPFEDLTSHRCAYDEKPLSVRQPCKRKDKLVGSGPFQNSTEHKENYNRKYVVPERYHQKDEFVASIDPLSSDTCYRSSYVDREPSRPGKGYKPITSFMMSTDPLESETNYRSSYLKTKFTKTRLARIQSEITMSRVPLESNTMYRDNYSGATGAKAKSTKPSCCAHVSDVPFSGDTTFRAAYVRHDRAEPAKSTRPTSLRPVGRFRSETAYRAFYTEKPMSRRQSSKVATRREPGAFSSATSYRDSYSDHKQPRPAIRTGSDRYEPPETPFHDGSTYRDSYIGRRATDCLIVVPCDTKRLLY